MLNRQAVEAEIAKLSDTIENLPDRNQIGTLPKVGPN